MRAAFIIAILGMVVVGFQTSSAQRLPGNAETGHRYATDWCVGCHSVDAKTVGMFAADFTEVANLPSTTALSLKVFLQTSHKNMPNFILKPSEADDIIAYILSLRRK